MIVPERPEDIEERIKGCEQNLERLKTCSFTALEKLQLRKIYSSQLEKYKRKRLSFLNLNN